MWQLYFQDRGLQFIHSEITADKIMSILRAHPVVATPPHSFGELLIAANDQSGVAGGAKIFRRIETETSGVANCSGFGRATLEWKLRADRLGGVFDQNQIMLA